jgi:hypothetical protein
MSSQSPQKEWAPREVRVQLNSSFARLLGGRPIPFMIQPHDSQNHVCVSERVVNFQGFQGRRFRLRERFRWREETKEAEQRVHGGYRHVSLRVRGIRFNRLPRVCYSSLQPFGRPFVRVVLSLQEQLVGLAILGRSLGQALRPVVSEYRLYSLHARCESGRRSTSWPLARIRQDGMRLACTRGGCAAVNPTERCVS